MDRQSKLDRSPRCRGAAKEKVDWDQSAVCVPEGEQIAARSGLLLRSLDGRSVGWILATSATQLAVGCGTGVGAPPGMTSGVRFLRSRLRLVAGGGAVLARVVLVAGLRRGRATLPFTIACSIGSHMFGLFGLGEDVISGRGGHSGSE